METRYIWGPDLSGTVGRGRMCRRTARPGVNGHIQRTVPASRHKNGVFLYAGNGNVAQIVNLWDNYVINSAGQATTAPAGTALFECQVW